MRCQLLSVPLIIVTFAIGLFLTPYSSTGGIRGLILGFVSAVQNDLGAPYVTLSDYYGCWGGSGGDVIELRERYIKDVEQGKSYQYHVVRHFNGPGLNGYLIELTDLGTNSNLRKYVYLGFEDNGWVSYFGYDSMDDFYYGRSSVAASLSRAHKTILQ